MFVFSDPEGCIQWFLPGFYYLGFHVGYVMALLAAFIERPFLERAGVRRWTLLFAVRANALVVIVGLFLSFFYCMIIMSHYPAGPESGIKVWLALTVAGFLMSVLVKGLYLESHAIEPGQQLRWRMIYLASFVSSASIFLFGFSLLWLRRGLYDAAEHIYGLSPSAYWAVRGWILAISHIAAMIVMIVILVSFFRKKNVAERTGRTGSDA